MQTVQGHSDLDAKSVVVWKELRLMSKKVCALVIKRKWVDICENFPDFELILRSFWTT